MARLQNPLQKMTVLLLLLAILIFTFAASVSLGSYRISLYDVCQSFLNFNSSSTEHILVMNTRFPRAVVAATVGACLAVAGALTQALTKNPLAAPSVLGINSGAVFFAVVAASMPNILPPVSIVWAAFGGAAISSAAVYFLGSIGRDGLTPIKIILAGSAITALFTSFTQGLLVLSESGMKNTLSWLAGAIVGRNLEHQKMVLPYMIIGMLLAFALAVHINILTSGDDVAKGLGQRTGIVKLLISVSVILLAGSSVSIAGSIGFVGLMVPHISRFFVGRDHRWIIPYSAVMGASLLLLADISARLIIMPSEAPVGVMTAVIGAPFYIYIARRSLRGEK
ncbi:putative siderophore transport system permease protein YfiZ [Lacrimispora xylanolytica]